MPGLDKTSEAPADAVAHVYQQLLNDLREGTALVPDFDHAVRRHRSLESITPDRTAPGTDRT